MLESREIGVLNPYERLLGQGKENQNFFSGDVGSRENESLYPSDIMDCMNDKILEHNKEATGAQMSLFV